MVDEITKFTRIVLSNGTTKLTYAPGNFTPDQSGTIFYQSIHSIGTTEESVTAFGDIGDGSEGQIIIQNLDAANYVQVGFATGVYGIRLTANNPDAQFNAEPSVSLFLKANTSACNVLITCLEV